MMAASQAELPTPPMPGDSGVGCKFGPMGKGREISLPGTYSVRSTPYETSWGK